MPDDGARHRPALLLGVLDEGLRTWPVSPAPGLEGLTGNRTAPTPPQDLKTSRPQDLKTSRPQDPKTPRPSPPPEATAVDSLWDCGYNADPRVERCRSGRSGRSRKPLTLHGVQGFESLPLRHDRKLPGEVSEWPKEHAWKACVGVTPPRVRIPPSPPTIAAGSPPWSPGPVHRRPSNRVRPGREQH